VSVVRRGEPTLAPQLPPGYTLVYNTYTNEYKWVCKTGADSIFTFKTKAKAIEDALEYIEHNEEGKYWKRVD
jgi:hypothetical protein